MAPADYNGKLINLSFPRPRVLLVSLNRAPVNAFSEPLWREMHRHFDRASTDPDVHVVVLASALAKVFTAGLDITEGLGGDGFEDYDVGRKALLFRQHITDFQDAITSIEKCSKPVIGAAHGHAPGLALDILSACDIRIAAKGTLFSIREVQVGLAADIGTLQRFPKIVGNGSLTRELALTARDFDADEALRIGFLSRVVDGGRDGVTEAAVKLAEQIASKSPIAVIGTKYLLNASRDLSVADGLALTTAWNMGMLQASDMVVSMAAWAQKQKPEYDSLPKALKHKL